MYSVFALIEPFPLALVYFGQLAAFSLSLLLVSDRSMRWPIIVWLMSNLLNATSVIAGYPSMTAFGVDAKPATVALTIVSLGLKRIALLPHRQEGRFASSIWLTNIFMALGVLAAFAIEPKFLPMLPCAVGAILSLWTIPAILANRQWCSYWGRPFVVASLVTSTFFLTTRMIVMSPSWIASHTSGPVQTAQGTTIAVIGMIASSVILQTGFLGLLISRQNRARLLATRRSARAAERSIAAQKHAREIRKLAQQRLGLLHLLTHEVRQPLHNAQAALQSVLIQLARQDFAPQRLEATARKTQAILDDITLSLSNAIIGTSLIEGDRIGSLRECGMVELAEMARLDCPPNTQARIVLVAPASEMFVPVDPVLLRLALRNLLDNALKYSPVDTEITLTIESDEIALGVLFRVTNPVLDTALLIGDIFAREQRGQQVEQEGKGLGLYIVGRAAALHGGWSRMVRHSENVVAFELFIPDSA